MTQQEQYYRYQTLRHQQVLRAYAQRMAKCGYGSGSNPPVQEEVVIPSAGGRLPDEILEPGVLKVTLKGIAEDTQSQPELIINVEHEADVDEQTLGFIFRNDGEERTAPYVKPYLNSEFVLCSKTVDENTDKATVVGHLKFNVVETDKCFHVYAENDILKKKEI